MLLNFPKLERSVVEVGFLLALVAAIAGLHYTRGFHSAFAHLASDLVAVQQSSPLDNYLSLLAATVAAYLIARGACVAASRLPGSVRSSPSVKVAFILVSVPAAAWVLFLALGSPPLGKHVVVRWVVGNWERNGKQDAAWCARLFVLLLCWQALLAVVVAFCSTLGGMLVAIFRLCTGKLFSSGKERLTTASRELERPTYVSTHLNGHGPSNDVTLKHQGRG